MVFSVNPFFKCIGSPVKSFITFIVWILPDGGKMSFPYDFHMSGILSRIFDGVFRSHIIPFTRIQVPSSDSFIELVLQINAINMAANGA